MLLFTRTQSQDRNSTTDKSVQKKLRQNLSIYPNWLKEKFSRLRIGQKIGYGYALAIGIAIFGTGAGLKLGDYLRKEALSQLNVSQQQQQLLQKLQNTVFKARSHAARIPAVLGDRVWLEYENDRFFLQINDAKVLISDNQSSREEIAIGWQ